MSVTTSIQLGRHQYIGGTNKDAFVNLGLHSSRALLDDQNLFRIVNALQQAQDERVKTHKYRVHGTINTISFLSNKPTTWTTPQDLIQNDEIRDLRTDFELCLGYVARYVPQPALGSGYYERRMKILATSDLIDVMPCGFSRNVFSEAQYNFMLNGQVDLAGLVSEGLGSPWPVTDLLLYMRPRGEFKTIIPASPVTTSNFHPDTEYGFRDGEASGTPEALEFNLAVFTRPSSLTTVTDAKWTQFIYPDVLNLFRLGDVRMTPANVEKNQAYIRAWAELDVVRSPVDGEIRDSEGLIPSGIVYFNSETLVFEEVSELKYSMSRTLTMPATTQTQIYLNNLGYRSSITGTSINTTLGFQYNPIQIVPIRTFSEFVERGAIEDVAGIPEYATPAPDGSGDLLWRDLLDPGYVEPSSNLGNQFPFVNGCHYVYAPLTFVIGPDLTNPNSFQAFRTTRLSLEAPTFSL